MVYHITIDRKIDRNHRIRGGRGTESCAVCGISAVCGDCIFAVFLKVFYSSYLQ